MVGLFYYIYAFPIIGGLGPPAIIYSAKKHRGPNGKESSVSYFIESNFEPVIEQPSSD